MGMRCYLKILHISYKDHVINEEVRAKIQQAIGPHKNLLVVWYLIFLSFNISFTHYSGTGYYILYIYI